MARLVGLWLLLLPLGGAALSAAGQSSVIDDAPLPVPRLIVEAPPALSPTASRLRTYDTTRLAGVMRVVGLSQPGPPIHIELIEESSEVARTTPAWIVGFAVPSDSAIALFPARTPSYPDDSLDALLLHEVAHVLVYRAAGSHWVPRWFNEGLAMTAERVWGLQDRAHVATELVLRSRVDLADIDALFGRDRAGAVRAYALAGAFLRHLLTDHGADAGARILSRVATGRPFEAAFREAIGYPLDTVEASFWRRAALWNRWIPFLTSTVVLWIGISMLALYAIRHRRAARAAIRQRWADEEDGEMDDELDEPAPWVH